MSASADTTALRREAVAHLYSGRVAPGIEAWRQLVAADPSNPDDWFNLAYLERTGRRFEEALASYAEALARGIAGPEEVHLNRAVILSEHLNRGPEAEAELKAALAANPRFTLAWLNLGNLYEDWGSPAEARAAYAQALALEPGNGRALSRIAVIDSFGGGAAGAVGPLRAALATPGLPAEDAAEIGFALATALDASGDYPAAFAAARAANAASRATMPPGLRYDRAAHERRVDAILRAFDRPAPPAAEPTGAPLFICGMFRSGSTLAEQILGRHSAVTVGGELEFIPALIRDRLPRYPLVDAPAADLRAAYRADLTRALGTPAGLVTDKRCDNVLHIGLIKTIFPDARIVHTHRQPLDNFLSVYFLHFDHSIGYGLDLGDIAHWYDQYRRLMAHWRGLYPESIHDLDYDATVADPRATIAPLLRFCGLPWEEACLSAHAATNAVRTGSVWQVRQPLHSRSSGRWRNYAAELGDLVARYA